MTSSVYGSRQAGPGLSRRAEPSKLGAQQEAAIMGVLDGKVAIITGATSGIGARTAELFAEEGATVVLAGRRAELGHDIAARIGAAASFVQTDVADAEQVRALIEGAAARFGRLDVLFNNAGTGIPHRSIVDLDLGEYDSLMALLVRSVAVGMKYAAPIMIRQRSGSIINTGSVAAFRAGAGSQTYCAAKAAVVHFSRVVAAELGEYGVRVNSLSPGAIVTGIFSKGIGIEAGVADRQADLLTARFAKSQPIPRAGMPDDIARGALYLASDASSFVNGTDLLIDGGMIAGPRFSQAVAARGEVQQALREDAAKR
jgi:NAD(P)-dependent dehydrogenase (short-subunit alcohol dehydrogenase family)